MKIVVCLSGGLDSAVLLWSLIPELVRDQDSCIYCLSVNYGQRHHRELRAGAELVTLFGWAATRVIEQVNPDRKPIPADLVYRYTIDLTSIKPLLKGSALTDSRVAVPHGHYTDASMQATVVPNRNMILLSVASAWAVSLGAPLVVYAAHAGDHAIYPDCRPAFVEALDQAITLANPLPRASEKSQEFVVHLYTPYLHLTKAQIVAEGAKLGVPFEKTWSCYEGGQAHCGACGACVERKEAFKIAEVDDPTVYLTDLSPQPDPTA